MDKSWKKMRLVPLLLMLAALPALADDALAGHHDDKDKDREGALLPAGRSRSRRLSNRSPSTAWPPPGRALRYTATAEEVYLRDAADKPTASFLHGFLHPGRLQEDSRTAPVTFVYNEGPGWSSIWPGFLGMVGPRIRN